MKKQEPVCDPLKEMDCFDICKEISDTQLRSTHPQKGTGYKGQCGTSKPRVRQYDPNDQEEL